MKRLLVNFNIQKSWLLLLAITDLFFIFLLWVISPASFSNIVVIILLFTIFILMLGHYIDRKQQRRRIKLLGAWLDDPNDITEQNLLSSLDKFWHQIICDTSVNLREQSSLLKDKTLELQNYQEFIEAWTHEIKTPLTLAVMLLDNHIDEMSPYVYKRMNYVRHSINADVEKILYYARLQAAHVDYQFEKVNLSDLVNEILEEFKDLRDERNIKLRLELTPVEIISDKKVLSFVLSQLLSNAFKYSEQNNGIIWATINKQNESGDICLSIRDNGNGAAPEDIPFLFDKGFTGNHPNRQRSTGMGLYFTKKYAQALSIEIEVQESVPMDHGFAISLKFPVLYSRA